MPRRISQGRGLSLGSVETSRGPIIRSITHAPDQTVARPHRLHWLDSISPLPALILPHRFSSCFAGRRPIPTRVEFSSSTRRQLIYTYFEFCKHTLRANQQARRSPRAANGRRLRRSECGVRVVDAVSREHDARDLAIVGDRRHCLESGHHLVQRAIAPASAGIGCPCQRPGRDGLDGRGSPTRREARSLC